MKWFVEVMKKYAEFSGRAHRKEYWMFVLMVFIISFGMSLVTTLIGQLLGVGLLINTATSFIFCLAILVPSIAVGIRRMHDTGRPGWWLFVPIASLVFLASAGQPGQNEYGEAPTVV